MRCRNAATQNRSEVVSSSPGEAIEIGAAQVMLHRQVAEGLIQAGNDVFRPGKQTTALRHIHGPEFPGPFEYILENVPVNGLEVTHHEMPRKGPVFELPTTGARHLRLEIHSAHRRHAGFPA